MPESPLSIRRASPGTECNPCLLAQMPRPATVTVTRGNLHQWDLCDPCRAAIAAPLPVPVFTAESMRGRPVEFRPAPVPSGVEFRWADTSEPWAPLHGDAPVGKQSPAELRAIADARESTR
jgi:hypothetical protein